MHIPYEEQRGPCSRRPHHGVFGRKWTLSVRRGVNLQVFRKEVSWDIMDEECPNWPWNTHPFHRPLTQRKLKQGQTSLNSPKNLRWQSLQNRRWDQAEDLGLLRARAACPVWRGPKKKVAEGNPKMLGRKVREWEGECPQEHPPKA